MAAGNTIVVKASEQAPAALFKLAELVDETGFPPGVINILTGFGEPCGRVITSHAKVARVALQEAVKLQNTLLEILQRILPM